MAWDNKVPFADGQPVVYVNSHGGVGQVWVPGKGNMPVEWRDNDPFEAVLSITGKFRGQSASRLIFEVVRPDGTSFRAEMFIADAVKTFDRGVEPGGTTRGLWHFTKRGQNYGIAPFTEKT